MNKLILKIVTICLTILFVNSFAIADQDLPTEIEKVSKLEQILSPQNTFTKKLTINSEDSFNPVYDKKAKSSLWKFLYKTDSNKKILAVTITPKTDGNDFYSQIEEMIVKKLNATNFKCNDIESINVTKVYKLKEDSKFKFIVFEWQGGASVADLKIILSNDDTGIEKINCTDFITSALND